MSRNLTFKAYLQEARYYGENDDVECPICYGKGWLPILIMDEYEKEPCDECGGQGKVTQRRRNQIKAKNDQIVQSSKNLR